MFIRKIKKEVNQVLTSVINDLTNEKLELNQKLRKEKEKNNIYQKDFLILLKTNSTNRKTIKKLENKIIDLENNIDFLYDNLSNTKKKLIKRED